MTWKLPHDKDFATNADLPRYLNENAQAIENKIIELDNTIIKLKGLQNALGLSDEDLKDL